MENSSTSSVEYPWKININYQTHEEYQIQLCSIMNINEGEHLRILDKIYESTQINEKMMKLSRLASEKCLGYVDAEYGQIMLFSYDCFDKFHPILQRFFGGDMSEVSEETVNANYKWLEQYFENVNKKTK
jgi:hypothetical protein